MHGGFSSDVEASLKGFEKYDWHAGVLRASKAAEGGNEKAFLEVVRSVRSTRLLAELTAFQETVLSDCDRVQDTREQFECAQVCRALGYAAKSYEVLRRLSERGYWPAQFQLGSLLLQDDAYRHMATDGHALLRASAGFTHFEGAFLSMLLKSRDSSFPVWIWYFLRA